ncbi:MAG: nucleotidyltransferase domain-containing protein, partial [Chloroflexota bacterium]
MANKDKKIIREMRRLLQKMREAVNKYEIQYLGSDLGVYSGSKLALILPELLDVLQTATIRYTLSATTNLITKTGSGARQAVPIWLNKLMTTDQWLVSGYRYALEQVGWIYKAKPDALRSYLAELEAAIADDKDETANRERYTRELATWVDSADLRISGDDVLGLLDGKHAMNNDIMRACWSAPDEIKDLANALYNVDLRMNRIKVVQGVIDKLVDHSQRGWHSYQEVYHVISDFLQQTPSVRQVKVFGSRADNTYRADSDIDLALVLRSTDKEEALQLYRDNHAQWRGWFAGRFPYDVDLNLYID